MCEVTTAKPIDAAMSKEVQAALSGFLKKGQKALVTYKVPCLFYKLVNNYAFIHSHLFWTFIEPFKIQLRSCVNS